MTKRIINIFLSLVMIVAMVFINCTDFVNVKADGGAYLCSGQEFSKRLKRLAGNPSATYSSTNTAIKSIQMSANAPGSGITTADISKDNDESVLAWFDNGTIYVYSEESPIYMNLDSSYLLYNFKGLTSVDTSGFDTGAVKYMSSMFLSCSSLTSLDLSNWDTHAVTSMLAMFQGCSSLTSLNLSGWDTSAVTGMASMFEVCSSLASLDLSSFNTSAVTNMGYMFSDCKNLTSLDVSSFDTSAVTNMVTMFRGCKNLTSLDLSDFDTSAVKYMDSMFYNCSNLEKIYVGDDWNTDNVTSSTNMFHGCNKLVGSSGTAFDSSKPIDKTYAHIDEGIKNPGYLSDFSEGKYKALMNEPYHSFNILKKSSYDGTGIQGAVFSITGTSDYGTPVSMTSTSGTGGIASFSHLEPGTYLLKEISTAEHFVLDETERIVTITPKDTVTVEGLKKVGTNFEWVNERIADDEIMITKKWQDNLTGDAANNRALPVVNISTERPAGGYKITYDANGGHYASPSSTTNVVNYKYTEGPEVPVDIVKYSYTENVGSDGTKLSNYGNNWNNSNIRGTDRDSASSDAHVITIDGAETISATVTYGGESASYDYVCVWQGSYPGYTALNNNSTAISFNGMKKLGGGNHTSASNTKTATVSGNTLTFSYRSDSGGVGNDPYGYYAVIKGYDASGNPIKEMVPEYYDYEVIAGEELMPVSNEGPDFVFEGWYMDQACTVPFVKDKIPGSREITVYAKYRDTRAYLTTGENFNKKIKQLAGQSSPNYNTVNNNITSIQKSSSAPGSGITTEDVSRDQNGSILAWFDNGTIYVYSEPSPISGSSLIYMNPDSSYLANRLEGLISIDISSFDTSSVTNMYDMFYNCKNLTGLDVSGWDTSSVTNMFQMFYSCTNLTSLDVSNWDTSSVTDMRDLFDGCNNLTSLDVSHWDTSSVKLMNSMFSGCNNLTNLDMSNWDTSSVTHMNSMFYNCKKLTSLNVSDWDTSSVTMMSGMFDYCNNLTSLDVSDWNTSSVKNMSNMFTGCNNLANLDVSDWNTSSVTDMSGMFSSCNNLTSLDVSNWDTSSVTMMSGMFNSCTNLASLDVSDWNTSSVTTMGSMFSSCEHLTSLDVSDWDTSSVTNMNGMFFYCVNLTSLDVSNWNTSSATDMGNMFNICTKLTSLDVSNWDTSSVTTMYRMFYFCNMDTLDVSNWNTSSVTNLSYVFYGCDNLTSLDVSNWDTSSVTNMSNMFNGCYRLTTIYASNKWNTDAVTNSTNMFAECTALVGGAGTTYSSSNPSDKTYAHIDGGTSNPGYFTAKP